MSVRVRPRVAADDRAVAQVLDRSWGGSLVVSRGTVHDAAGVRLAAVHRGAVDEVRRRTPSIPLVGSHGIEVHDEVELDRAL